MKHNTPAQEAKSLGTLFFTFFKIGLFTFGGGYAMIALLEEEFIQRRRWLDKDEFLDMAAIAESTPGPVAINSATYLGYKLAKVPGAATATVAVCLPSFLIIYAISLFFRAVHPAHRHRQRLQGHSGLRHLPHLLGRRADAQSAGQVALCHRRSRRRHAGDGGPLAGRCQCLVHPAHPSQRCGRCGCMAHRPQKGREVRCF